MFSIISTMFLGIGIGYGLRNWSILQKTEKTISLTIFLLLFILGVSIGSDNYYILHGLFYSRSFQSYEFFSVT